MINLDKNKELVVMSAFNNGNSYGRNLMQHDLLKADLKASNYSFKEVKGRYKGVDEDSFIVHLEDLRDINDLKALAIFYKQESILYIADNSRNAYLHTFGKNDPLLLGKITHVSKDVAMRSEAFTYDHQNDNYFIIK